MQPRTGAGTIEAMRRTLGLVLLLCACDGEAAPADGDIPDLDAGDPGMCVTVTCDVGERCVPETGECVCADGFAREGDCVEIPPDDPRLRTEAEVCEAWATGHVETAATPWMAGAGGCDPGTMPTEAVDDTVVRVNAFRWLAGLPPIAYDGSAHAELMDCASMMSQNSALSHDPPMSWTCWTSGGADAAGRSNIAFGYGTSADAINGYMTDVGTMSLGHRRWILGTRLSSVEVGFSASGGRPGQCLGVFSRGGSSSRRWTAYPNPGFAPIEMVSSGRGEVTWSLQANDFDLPDTTAVQVELVGSDRQRPVHHYLTGGGGPPASVGFTPQSWSPRAGETYRVTVSGTAIGDIVYETTLVRCP